MKKLLSVLCAGFILAGNMITPATECSAEIYDLQKIDEWNGMDIIDDAGLFRGYCEKYDIAVKHYEGEDNLFRIFMREWVPGNFYISVDSSEDVQNAKKVIEEYFGSEANDVLKYSTGSRYINITESDYCRNLINYKSAAEICKLLREKNLAVNFSYCDMHFKFTEVSWWPVIRQRITVTTGTQEELEEYLKNYLNEDQDLKKKQLKEKLENYLNENQITDVKVIETASNEISLTPAECINENGEIYLPGDISFGKYAEKILGCCIDMCRNLDISVGNGRATDGCSISDDYESYDVLKLCDNEIGDINSDGIIDMTDLSELSLELLGDKDTNQFINYISDIDNDGTVNVADLARLMQYVSNKIK